LLNKAGLFAEFCRDPVDRDTDGTRPGCWRYVAGVQDRDLPADDSGYR
jgi:hypothetical protein